MSDFGRAKVITSIPINDAQNDVFPAMPDVDKANVKSQYFATSFHRIWSSMPV